MKGHQVQRVTVGLDAGVRGSCECGFLWTSDTMAEAQEVVIRHALNPNVGDPTRPTITVPSSIPERTPNAWVDAHLKPAAAPAPAFERPSGTRRKGISPPASTVSTSGKPRREQK